MNCHRKRLPRIVIAGIVALFLATGLLSTASAHETREVEGEFQFVVGFMNEPAYVNEINGLDLRISYLNGGGDSQDEQEGDDHDDNGDSHPSDAAPVENAEATLRVQVQYGDETRELDLRGVWGQPGHYTADVIPTQTGTYNFQIVGEIDGVEVNEIFRGSPDTFSEVESRDALEFPEEVPQTADDTDQATAFGIAGVVAGLLGLLAGGAAYYKVSNAGGKPNPAQQRREQRLAEQRENEQS